MYFALQCAGFVVAYFATAIRHSHKMFKTLSLVDCSKKTLRIRIVQTIN
jgi:hypothetical protein